MIPQPIRKQVAILGTLVITLLLVSCGVSTPSAKIRPMPTLSLRTGQGQQLLNSMAKKLNAARTLHGIFDLSISGQTVNGSIRAEVWKAAPDKSRTIVLQSSITQPTTGTVTVTDGKREWEYDPSQKIVYEGSVITSSTNTSSDGQSSMSGGGQDQSLFLLDLVQSVFTQSDGTLQSSQAMVNGRSVYDIHVVPSARDIATGGLTSFSYAGEVYIDKTTQQPVLVHLAIQEFGDVVMNLPVLELNQSIPARTFTFVVPTSAKVLPFSQLNTLTGSGSGTLTFIQAQQQAGYHLLSIPASNADYALNGVTALGSIDNQIYTLNYMKGNITITIAEGKPLANIPSSGQRVSIRSTIATISSTDGNTILAWTEKGIGIRMTAPLANNLMESIAEELT